MFGSSIWDAIMSENSSALCPAQQRAYDFPIGAIFHCTAPTGQGKTTVLNALHRKLGGRG